MFARLSEQYRNVVQDLVMSLQALARTLQQQGCSASCYVCGDGREGRRGEPTPRHGDAHR